MIAADFKAYYRFRQLDKYKNVKHKGVIGQRKQPRFDLVAHLGFWESLDKIKSMKGEIYLTLVPSDKNRNHKQGDSTPEYYLQCRQPKIRSMNFSGIRFEFSEGKRLIYGSGEPSLSARLSGGIENPFFKSRKDGFLFIFSEDMEQLEIVVIKDGRDWIDAYRKQLSLGLLDDKLSEYRKQAKEYVAL